MNQTDRLSTLPRLSLALDILTGDDLKQLLKLLPADRKPTRKAELIAAVEEHLTGIHLEALWERLDETQRLAVAETIYNTSGNFQARRFGAKYGRLPIFGTKDNPRSYLELPSLLRLFLYRDNRYGDINLTVPEDLAERLRDFVPKPPPPTLPFREELPEYFDPSEYRDGLQGDSDSTLREHGAVFTASTEQSPLDPDSRPGIPLVCRATERDALVEMAIVLRLIDSGKLAVSEKTLLPGKAALRQLAGLLPAGDYYPPEACSPEDPKAEIGAIKPFAWPLLVQAAGFAELHGQKLALTQSGRTALARSPADSLRGIWQRWMKTRKFDEFNRIDNIKGQHGKAKRSMTSPAERRAKIVEALCRCPPGVWIRLEDFSRYMQADGHDFEITRDPYSLYIGDSNYGSLAYGGAHRWSILQKRYLCCVLFEYAATLGLIDVAYVEPWEGPFDYRDLWAAEWIPFLSRYDGLCWFRLNPLGAFCLGLATEYRPSTRGIQSALRVLPNQEIRVVSEALSTEEILFLEVWANQEDEKLWRLDQGKILKSVENGRDIAELRNFLGSRDSQELPELVEGVLATTARKAKALKNVGTVFLIECADEAIAEQIAQHPVTRSLCQSAGPGHLVVRIESEERFRKAVNGLGFGMPKV
ncbi:MAG: hypothetical protein ACU843_15400 [Gammaproteobacteria bacterium]